MARRCCALMRRYWARSAPWRPPDRRSPPASAMGRRIPDRRATLPVGRREDGRGAEGRARDQQPPGRRVSRVPEARLQARARSRRLDRRAHGHRAGARAVKPPGTAPPPRRWALPDGRAPYLQTFPGPFLRQLFEQQSAFAVQVAPDGKHAGSVVVVLLVDVVVVVVAGTVVVVVGDAVVVVVVVDTVVVDTVVVVVVVASVVVVVVPGKVVVVVVLGRVVVVVVLAEVVVVLVGPAAASRFRASKLPSPVTRS